VTILTHDLFVTYVDPGARVRLSGVDRPDLSVALHRAPGEVVLALAGEIDMSTVQRLAKEVGEILVTEPPPRVVLDMGGITFCDSQGLGTLVVLSRKATLAQSCLVLVNVGDFLLRVLDITGLRDALMIQNAAA
jgi:anti-sigma B factor antagonist